MEVNCEGCAGCCLDWRPLVEGRASIDRDRRGLVDHRNEDRPSGREPLDDQYNLVPLSREEVRAFLDAGLGDALTPRLWLAAPDDGGDRRVEVDGRDLAAIAGRPAFFVGLCKPPKPVAPFGRAEPTWLASCVFLDPSTLQCRIHDDELYPAECRGYPGHNLALEQRTECERVEDRFGGERLLADGPAALDGLLLGPQALGGKVFCHPEPEALDGVVDRLAAGAPTREDRATFVAVAAASSPGTLAISDPHYDEARQAVLAADSWAGRAVAEWTRRCATGRAPTPDDAAAVEDDRGAPETPGWDAVD